MPNYFNLDICRTISAWTWTELSQSRIILCPLLRAECEVSHRLTRLWPSYIFVYNQRLEQMLVSLRVIANRPLRNRDDKSRTRRRVRWSDGRMTSHLLIRFSSPAVGVKCIDPGDDEGVTASVCCLFRFPRVGLFNVHHYVRVSLIPSAGSSFCPSFLNSIHP